MARGSSNHAQATPDLHEHDYRTHRGESALDPGEGERKLMQAVLSEAIVCLTGRSGAARERYQLAAEALRWVRSRDTSWPFSFESICDMLGIDADSLRRRLMQHAMASPTGDSHTGSNASHPLRVVTLLRMRGNDRSTKVRLKRSYRR
jgi:hypothetical protein